MFLCHCVVQLANIIGLSMFHDLLTFMRNNSGSKIDPDGTLHVMLFVLVFVLSHSMNYFLDVR